ncbi:hypothetical protein BH09MYX1_BH09MYX1_39360 [soil metagenome]
MSSAPRPRPDTPTSTGTFARTPFPHLLVYSLEKELDGTFEFQNPSGDVATLLVRAGQPAKIHVPSMPLYLGQVMVELGFLTAADRDASLSELAAARVLHGKLLVGMGLVNETQLVLALRSQLLRKLGVLFQWPAASTFTFYAGFDGLDHVGGDPQRTDPMPALWSGVREASVTEHAQRVIDHAAKTRLRLARGAQLDRFELRPEERRLIDLLRVRQLTVDELVKSAENLTERAAKLLLYCFLITKQLELVPIGEEVGPPSSSDSESRIPAASPSRTQPVGRVKVKRALARSYPVIEENIRNAATDQRASPPPGVVKAQDDPRRTEIIERARTIEKQTYFEMLAVSEAATPDEVKASYFALARTWHPDKLPASLGDVKDACSRVFARLSEAHSTLIDSEKRARYTQVVQEGGATPEEQDAVANVLEATLDFQKAEISLRRGDMTTAEVLARKAHTADPMQAEYLALLAWLESMKPEGQGAEATQAKIAMLLKATSLNPKCERAYFYRAMLYKRSGNEGAAYIDFKMAAQLNVHNVDAQRELRLIAMRGTSGPNKPDDPKRDGGKTDKPGLFGRLFKK